jgi:O-antigen biosynthesis protein
MIQKTLATIKQCARKGLAVARRGVITPSRLRRWFVEPIKKRINDRTILAKMKPLRKWNPDSPVFSVVIPIYDRTWELEKAIDSILAQSFKNFELILVCDGSPDATLAVVDKYAAHPQVRVHKFADNSGNACRGRNTGIKMAKGRYVAFMDSDDIAVPQRLDITLFHLLRTGADMVYGSVTIISDGARQIPGVWDGQFRKSVATTLRDLENVNPAWTCTVAVKKDAIDRCGPFRTEMRYREDQELWLRLAHHGCKLHPIDEMLAYYRFHQGNAELLFKDQDAHWKKLMLEKYKQPYVADAQN